MDSWCAAERGGGGRGGLPRPKQLAALAWRLPAASRFLLEKTARLSGAPLSPFLGRAARAAGVSAGGHGVGARGPLHQSPSSMGSLAASLAVMQVLPFPFFAELCLPPPPPSLLPCIFPREQGVHTRHLLPISAGWAQHRPLGPSSPGRCWAIVCPDFPCLLADDLSIMTEGKATGRTTNQKTFCLFPQQRGSSREQPAGSAAFPRPLATLRAAARLLRALPAPPLLGLNLLH